MNIDPKQIQIPPRMRDSVGDTSELVESIKQLGIIQPIIVKQTIVGTDGLPAKYELVCGERRLRAALAAGLTEVPIRLIEHVDPLDVMLMEFEENVRRANFTWQEEVRAKEKIHAALVARHGDFTQSRTTFVERITSRTVGGGTGSNKTFTGWSSTKTAQTVGQSRGGLSLDLQLAEFLAEIPELASIKSKAEALRKIRQYKERILIKEMARRKRVSTRVTIEHGDCREKIKALATDSVACLIVDPPWGVAGGVESISMRRAGQWMSNDIRETLKLLRDLSPELDRVLMPHSHAYMFHAVEMVNEIAYWFEQLGFEPQMPPPIWLKEHFSLTDFERNFGGQYEMFTFALRGTRTLNTGRSNIFDFRRVSPSDKGHPNEKPEELLEELVKVSTQEDELVIDPFAGSGSTLRAALKLNRRAWGCELDEHWYNMAKSRLGGTDGQPN